MIITYDSIIEQTGNIMFFGFLVIHNFVCFIVFIVLDIICSLIFNAFHAFLYVDAPGNMI